MKRAVLFGLASSIAVGCDDATRTTHSLPLAPPAASVAAPNAEQIVFSGQTPPGFFTVPAGFWIWCEDEETGNPYEGRCAGSMYFYQLELIRPVQGGVTDLASGAHRMTVGSGDGAIACTLDNSPPVTKGASNAVT